jgi:fatty-acyl-CoA synthase/long-chain acyl-CoA synthetase
MLTLKTLVERSLKRYSSRVLMKFIDSVRNITQEITYAEFDVLSRKLANALRDLGLKKGDKVAFLLLNRPEAVISNFAAIRSGLVGVGINPILSRDDMEHIIRNSESRAVIVDYWLLEFIKERRGKLSNVDYFIAVPYGDMEVPDDFIDFNELVKNGSDGELDVKVEPEDVVFLVYTGGTTGTPKGAIHTHYSMTMNAIAHVIEFDIRDGEKLLLVTPLVHAAGAIALASLLKGSTCVVTFRFDVEEILGIIEREKITWFWAVPTMIYRMLDSEKLRNTDLSSLRTIVYGAAPMSPARLKEAIKVFGNIFIQLYGQVEVPQLISVLTKDEHKRGLYEREEILKSAGRASPHGRGEDSGQGRKRSQKGRTWDSIREDPIQYERILENG